MTLNDAVDAMRDRMKIRRTDWKYPKNAYLIIEERVGGNAVYIYQSYTYSPSTLNGYGFSLDDIISNNWQLCNDI